MRCTVVPSWFYNQLRHNVCSSGAVASAQDRACRDVCPKEGTEPREEGGEGADGGCPVIVLFPAFVAVPLLSLGRFSATPWTAARRASLFLTISWSLLKLSKPSVESVMPSNQLHWLGSFPLRCFKPSSISQGTWPDVSGLQTGSRWAGPRHKMSQLFCTLWPHLDCVTSPLPSSKPLDPCQKPGQLRTAVLHPG